jgi:hypothetical protein
LSTPLVIGNFSLKKQIYTDRLKGFLGRVEKKSITPEWERVYANGPGVIQTFPG